MEREKTNMALLSDLLDEYQSNPNNPEISEEVYALRRRANNIYEAFEKYKYLQKLQLEHYTYEAVARLALELHKRGVGTEQFKLAEKLPARLDFFNDWFNFL